MALVEAGQAAEVGTRLVAGHGLLVEPRHRWRVVAKDRRGLPPCVKSLGGDVQLAKDARLLQVTVGQPSRRVVVRDHLPLDILRERRAPHTRALVLGKEHTPHARLSCVGRSYDGGHTRHDLVPPRRPGDEAGGYALEVVQVGSDVFSDADPVLVGMLDPQLQGTKETTAAGQGDGQRPQLPDGLLPLGQAHSLLTLQAAEEVPQFLAPMWSQLDGLVYGVDEPSQDDLVGSPGAVALE